MGRLLKGLPARCFLAALAVLLLVPAVYAADPDTGSAEPEAKGDAPSAEAGKPGSKTDEPATDEAAPGDERAREAAAAGVELKGGLKIQELLAQGFLIKTTMLVPTEMVSRQVGQASPDALIVTLQKENAIAVCYYTLKSYARLRLAALRTCTTFR